MCTDRALINITALVAALNSVSVDNKTVGLSFSVYINSHQSGTANSKISLKRHKPGLQYQK